MPWLDSFGKYCYATDPDFSIFFYDKGHIFIIQDLDGEPYSMIHITKEIKIAFEGPLSARLREECKKVDITGLDRIKVVEALVDHLNGSAELIEFLKDRRKK